MVFGPENAISDYAEAPYAQVCEGAPSRALTRTRGSAVFHRTFAKPCGSKFASPVTVGSPHTGRSFFFGLRLGNPSGLPRRHSDHHPMNSTSFITADYSHVGP